MNAYNPNTGQTIEITEYGFSMLIAKGWVRAVDQTPTVKVQPNAQPIVPAVDMKIEMEKRKKELAALKEGNVTLIDVKALPTAVEPLPEFIPDAVEDLNPPDLQQTKKIVKPKAASGKVSGKNKANKK
jgi:hypothetical protein